MFRRTSLITLIICVFSLFSYHNISYADNPDNVTTEATQLSNREDDVDRAEENYNTIKRAMETLISEWNDNRVKVEAGENVTVAVTCGAIISAGVAIATGGSLAPAAFAALIALRTGAGTAAISWKSEEYLEAMRITLSAMDIALLDVKAAYNGGYMSVQPEVVFGLVVEHKHTVGYNPQYNAYLEAWASHSLIRLAAPNYVYDTKEKLDAPVNMSDLGGGYYHTGESGSGTEHAILKRLTYKHWDNQPTGYGSYDWNTVALPEDHECRGPCTVDFRSPHEAFDAHRKNCGTGDNVDDLIDTFGGLIPHELSIRTVEEGCGRPYYHCLSIPDTDHEEQTCSTSGCSVKYRNCLLHTFSHSNHSTPGTGQVPGLSPVNGLYAAAPGDTHEARLSILSKGATINWYVITPNDARNDVSTSLGRGTGDGTTTERRR